MTKFFSNKNSEPKLLSPLTLAFVGDAVYELLVREHLAAKGSASANRLHKQAVDWVRASSQAEVYLQIEPRLTEEEQSVLRRGRNANSTHAPKNAKLTDYRMATGVEALFGFLYLSEQTDRLLEVFGWIIEGRQNDEREI